LLGFPIGANDICIPFFLILKSVSQRTRRATKVPKNTEMDENSLSKIVIGHAIAVHRVLGPGLLESAYRNCLYYDLTQDGLNVEMEKPIPIVYKEVKLDHGYRVDLLVENKLVIEIKTVEGFSDVHTAQVLTYLKLGNYKLGILVNFHTAVLKNGIKRIIL
jgi:GxxExxY protein